MAGFKNEVLFCTGERLEPSNAQAISIMQMASTDVARINGTGSPEGAISANPSSLYHDRSSGDLWLKETGTGNTGWAQITTGSSDLHTAKFIVGDVTNGANYSTITAAIAAATAGNTVFLQQGTYTEDFSLKAGVDLAAFNANASAQSTVIKGKITADFNGFVGISGICLETNGDFCLDVTGAGDSNLRVVNCFIKAVDTIAINYDTTGGPTITFFYCMGDLGGVGAGYFTKTTAGKLRFYHCEMQNDSGVGGVADSTISANGFEMHYTRFRNNIVNTNSESLIFHCLLGGYTHSGANSFQAFHTRFNGDVELGGTSALGAQLYESIIGNGSLILNGSRPYFIDDNRLETMELSGSAIVKCGNCVFQSNTSTSIDVGVGCTLDLTNVTIDTSNVNAVVNAGTLNWAGIAFTDSSNVSGTAPTVLTFIPAGGSYESLAPYIVGDENAGYLLVQDAIDAAALAGATTNTPVNIYVKPKSDGSEYVEDLVFPNGGFNIIGVDLSYRVIQNLSDFPCAATITGSHTIQGDSTEQVKFQGLNLKNDNGTFFTLTTAGSSAKLLPFVNCYIIFGALGNDSTFLASTDNVGIQCSFTNCTTVDYSGTSTWFLDADLDDAVQSITIEPFYSKLSIGGLSTCTKTLSVSLQGRDSSFSSKFLVDSPAELSVDLTDCDLNLELESDNTDVLKLQNCYVAGIYDIVSTSLYEIKECIIDPSITFPTTTPNLINCSGCAGYVNVQVNITSNYTTTILDEMIPCDSTGGSFTVTLFAAPYNGMKQIVKDRSGDATANPITIDGNGFNIDGSSTASISLNYGALTLVFNGTEWSIV